MLAVKRSVIQPGRTGVTGSASAAGPASTGVAPVSPASACAAPSGSATSLTVWPRSAEALALPAVGRYRTRRGAVLDQVVLGEALRELTGLGVAQPDAIADAQAGRRRAEHRGLDLTGALGGGQLEPGGQVRGRQAIRAGRAGGRVAA